MCVCSTNLGFSVGYATNLGFSVGYVLCTYEYYVRMYLVSAGRNTFRPWTHTSDDSYMYQLSLVVATATVSSDAKVSRNNSRLRNTVTPKILPFDF